MSPSHPPLDVALPRSKRVFDLVAALVGLLVLLPALLLLAWSVRRNLGRPVIFRQERAGHGERIFTMYKFRTMTDARGPDGELLPDEERLTPFGEFLRSTSLDELPELWNVLRGEMSLVGPRPHLVRFLPLYSPEQRRRHAVMPGITGWAQINGRNNLSWQEKFRLDTWYVEHQSFGLDLRILALTVVKVLHRADVNKAGHATTDTFTGNGGVNHALSDISRSPD